MEPGIKYTLYNCQNILQTKLIRIDKRHIIIKNKQYLKNIFTILT